MVAKNCKIRPESQAKQSQLKVQNADSSLWSGLFALIKQCLSENYDDERDLKVCLA